MSTYPVDGRLHCYWPERNLTLFEHLPDGVSSKDNPAFPRTLLFIGGLYDSLGSVPYVPKLASYIHQCEGWTVMEIQMSSSGLGWANSDLDRDVEEIGKAVDYILKRVKSAFFGPHHASGGGQVVLMGHSTGSQDVLHYLYHQSEQERPSVNGAILQAAVSDREGLAMMREGDEAVQLAYEECLRIALNSTTENSQGSIVSLPPDLTKVLGWPRTHVSCKRFLSLASPFSPIRPELDDLFSSDLSDETLRKTFGGVGRRGLLRPARASSPSLLILLSANDEFTPKTVNKETLMGRWSLALKHGSISMASSSGVILGASHNIKETGAQFYLINRVLTYLNSIADGIREAV